jgi:hypothetical protein
MLAGVSLGARYGHVGQLDEDGAALFNKGQLYNATNGILWSMQHWVFSLVR